MKKFLIYLLVALNVQVRIKTTSQQELIIDRGSGAMVATEAPVVLSELRG